MNSDRKVPWVRISAEAVAIVGGILLAFAIDTWWDSRSDREMESQLLTRLRAELQENVVGIEEFAPISNSFDAGLTVVGELEDALAEGTESLMFVKSRFGFRLHSRTISVPRYLTVS
jgi:hypothetical protein